MVSTLVMFRSREIYLFDRYDKLAFRYVSYVAIPLLAGYTIYSLIYESHRGWYSFVISTLTSFVYMFGFVSTAMIHWITID
jgi:TRAP-type uncharacterized transport system fused permease subunit